MKLWARATIALLLIFVVGCGEDTEVRTYTVAKRPAPPTATDEAPTPVQTIGVIYPHKSTAWFLKLMDDPSKVESLSSEFRRLADSIQFGEDGSPQWKLTEGWKDQVLEQITYAKFTHADGVTATLTKLAANTEDTEAWHAYLQSNVNRWRDQVGLAPQDWEAMQPELEEFPNHSSENVKAYFVSLKGMRKSAGAGMGMGNAPFLDRMRAQAQSQPQPQAQATGPSATPPAQANPAQNPVMTNDDRLQLKYVVPEGWQEQPASGIRLASFVVQAQDKTASVSISTSTGQVPAAVEMWLKQVGKTPDEPQIAQIIQAATSGKVRDLEYRCYRIGDESNPEMAIRVAVIPIKENENLYVKMTGASALIEAQSQAMDNFISTLNW